LQVQLAAQPQQASLNPAREMSDGAALHAQALALSQWQEPAFALAATVAEPERQRVAPQERQAALQAWQQPGLAQELFLRAPRVERPWASEPPVEEPPLRALLR
jgi:hypothetical protein